MELKSIISLEFEKSERVYRMELPNEAPLGEAYEAASSFLVKLAELITDHAKNSAPKEPEPVEVEIEGVEEK